MKPLSPHDPLDDLIAAALHGELSPQERTDFETRLQTDPAADAAFQEAQLMHDLLEKTHRSAQPDDAFEQRMISGVRRKLDETQKPKETAWQSALILWKALNGFFGRRRAWEYATACAVILVGAFSLLVSMGSQVKSVFSTVSSELVQAQTRSDGATVTAGGGEIVFSGGTVQSHAAFMAAVPRSEVIAGKPFPATINGQMQANAPTSFAGHAGAVTINGMDTYAGTTMVANGGLFVNGTTTSTGAGSVLTHWREATDAEDSNGSVKDQYKTRRVGVRNNGAAQKGVAPSGYVNNSYNYQLAQNDKQVPASAPAPVSTSTYSRSSGDQIAPEGSVVVTGGSVVVTTTPAAPRADLQVTTKNGLQTSVDTVKEFPQTQPAAEDLGRKLIRNAQLDLEVKSFQNTLDLVTVWTKAAGGYVDTTNSQKGGNGKLQGTVVVKVLPGNLDAFLLKLRDLGEVRNQSISTDDVTKDYFDTQARLDNARKTEAQLQELLKRNNGKVSELLQVERELGRVRGEIEQMQGQLKLYDFQVQYATVTMQIREKDLNQAAAYLLKEQDEFSLFANNVEDAFKNARQAADAAKAQILNADLNHNSGSDVSADLLVMVAPDQIEGFLTQVRSLGRVANFTRQTQRVAKDGGDSDQPADQTLTEKDKVQVHLTIRSDDESRKQVALTVVTPAVDDALDKAKAAVLAATGAEILSSSLNKTPQGQTTGNLSVRVPGPAYHAVLDSLRALGRTASFSLQRDDNSGPGANGDDAPVIVTLALTDEDTPVQLAQIQLATAKVDEQAQDLKKEALAAGAEIKASSFRRQPDGMEAAQMSFRLPMARYPAFVETLKKLGKVESFTVDRSDRPDQARMDDSAPVQVDLYLHSQGDVVPDDSGLWATLRKTFGDGAGALFGSVRMIGVILAFLAPWLVTLVVIAWVARRIYVWKKK